MRELKVMHIIQTVRHVYQLKKPIASIFVRNTTATHTYKLHSVDLVLLDEFVDVPVIHPLGYHCILLLFQIYTE